MTNRYHITLHSPLGPRDGMLLLVTEGHQVTGSLMLLNFEQPVRGTLTDDRRICLRHNLRTAISDIACESTLEIDQGVLEGTLCSSWGNMRWTGQLETAIE